MCNGQKIINHIKDCGQCRNEWMTGLHCYQFDLEFPYNEADWEEVRVILNENNISLLPIRWGDEEE